MTNALSIHEILAEPSLLEGQKIEEVRYRIRLETGWVEETLRKGSRQGSGWVLRESSADGHPTGRMIRWHPGGGHHGPKPYWRVISNDSKSAIIPAVPEAPGV